MDEFSDDEQQANRKMASVEYEESGSDESDAIAVDQDEFGELPSDWITNLEEDAEDDSDWDFDVDVQQFADQLAARGPLPLDEEISNIRQGNRIVDPVQPPLQPVAATSRTSYDPRSMMVRRMSVVSLDTSDAIGYKKIKPPARLHQNQPYDESLDVGDTEEVASIYTPTPRNPRGRSRGDTPPDSRMSDHDDDDIETGQPEVRPEPRQKSAGRPSQLAPQSKQQVSDDDDDDDDGTESSGEDDDDDDDDDEDHGVALEGAYDPADYENLPVSSEIKELFQYITRYTPQAIELEHKLKPFIPDFIPAVGDIDAFIKIQRVDGKPDTIGLTVLDEPCAKQSDPTVLDLKLRSISRQTNTAAVVVKSVENAEKNPKAIENWIESISEIHRSKPPPNVHYTKNMPDIDTLMQEWPPEFEELLKEVSLPTADLDCDLKTFVEMICAVLDIPIYKSNIQSLHVLFTLYSEFKNSQHFKQLADDNQIDNSLKGLQLQDEDGDDRLVL